MIGDVPRLLVLLNHLAHPVGVAPPGSSDSPVADDLGGQKPLGALAVLVHLLDLDGNLLAILPAQHVVGDIGGLEFGRQVPIGVAEGC